MSVLVDVVELRRRGLRRPSEELRAAVPVRGVLSMKPSRGIWADGQRHAPLLAMLLAPELPEHLLEPLDQARVTRIRQGALLIVGLQEVVRPIRRVDHCRQAWWVRPVGAQP